MICCPVLAKKRVREAATQSEHGEGEPVKADLVLDADACVVLPLQPFTVLRLLRAMVTNTAAGASARLGLLVELLFTPRTNNR